MTEITTKILTPDGVTVTPSKEYALWSVANWIKDHLGKIKNVEGYVRPRLIVYRPDAYKPFSRFEFEIKGVAVLQGTIEKLKEDGYELVSIRNTHKTILEFIKYHN